MPFPDKKRECWAGEVKKIVQGEDFTRLLNLPLWKPHGKEGTAFKYRKAKTGFKLKRDAMTWEKEHWEKIFATQVNPEILSTFSSISGQYLKQVKTRSKGINTLRYKQKLIQDIIGFWGEDFSLPVETIHIENFLDHLFEQQGGKKANRSLRELSTLFNWMFNRKFIKTNPTTPIEKYSEDPFKKYVPPEKDIIRVIQIANAFEKDIIRAAYHSLARASELRRLKKTDCDFINGKVWFYTRKRQGGSLEGDKIDINKSLREILYRRCKLLDSEYVFPGPDGNRLKKNSLDKIMPRLCHKINFNSNNEPKPRKEQIKPFGLHAIRHHVAANLFMNYNYSVGEIQKILRHKRASTTDAYLKSIVDMDIARGLDALDDFEVAKKETATPEKIVRYPDN
jgi:integrase